MSCFLLAILNQSAVIDFGFDKNTQLVTDLCSALFYFLAIYTYIVRFESVYYNL